MGGSGNGCGSWLLGVTFIQHKVHSPDRNNIRAIFGFMLLHLHGECICSLVSCRLILELGNELKYKVINDVCIVSIWHLKVFVNRLI